MQTPGCLGPRDAPRLVQSRCLCPSTHPSRWGHLPGPMLSKVLKSPQAGSGVNLEFGCLWQETSQSLFLKRIGWITGLVSLFLLFCLSPQKNISLAKCWGQAYEDERSIPDEHLKKDCNVLYHMFGVFNPFPFCLRTHQVTPKRNRCPRLEWPSIL